MADETPGVQDPDDEPTFYARKQIRPDQHAVAAREATRLAMASRSGGRR